MANPTLPPDIGVPTPLWANDVNNWRAEDASWLLSRSILRFNNLSEWTSSPLFSRGAMAYLVGSVAGSEELAVGAGPGSASYILHGKNLKRADDGLFHRSLGSSVLLSANDVEIRPTIRTVSADGSTAKISGGSLSLGVATTSDVVVLSATGTSASLVSTKPLTITASNTYITNGISVGTQIVITGGPSTTLITPVYVSASELRGTLISNYVSTPTAKFANYDFSGNVFKNTSGPPVLDFTGQNSEVRANRVSLKVPPGGAVIDDGSPNTGMVATVRVATVAPVNGTDNYPLGTIWVRV